MILKNLDISDKCQEKCGKDKNLKREVYIRSHIFWGPLGSILVTLRLLGEFTGKNHSHQRIKTGK